MREKLSGTMHLQPVNADPPKAKATSEVARTPKKSAASVEATTAPENKKSTNSAPSKKKSQAKVTLLVNSWHGLVPLLQVLPLFAKMKCFNVCQIQHSFLGRA